MFIIVREAKVGGLSIMAKLCILVISACLLQATLAVKVKVVMHSDQDESKIEEDSNPPTETSWMEHKKSRLDATIKPLVKSRSKHLNVAEDRDKEYQEEDKTTTEKSKQQHPNELIFPLIYKQSHINSMFKFGENWYTWSTEKRTDGTRGVSYYICYEEPKHCDDVGWERTEALPKCAFQIDSLLPDDRACFNSFGVEPHSNGLCDGAEQMKVVDIIRSCGPRIRSLWRFVRVGRRPINALKPADVNSLICEDEEECFLTIEYRIHHDRITFSLHEPTRGQTYKSILKREVQEEEKTTTESHGSHVLHRNKKVVTRDEEAPRIVKKTRVRSKSKVEGKGIVKEHNDSGSYSPGRRIVKTKTKTREEKIREEKAREERNREDKVKEDLSEDISE